jgi:hypothetical protein
MCDWRAFAFYALTGVDKGHGGKRGSLLPLSWVISATMQVKLNTGASGMGPITGRLQSVLIYTDSRNVCGQLT